MIQDIEKVIRARKSIRTYSNIDIEPETKQMIIDFMQSDSVGLFGNKVEFYWIDGNSKEFKDLKLGTYGVISGTKSFIVGKVIDSEKNFEDFGYCMEKLVLYCTGMNIGTCWLGGTYKKTAFSASVNLQEDEFIPAVTPVGYFGTKKQRLIKCSDVLQDQTTANRLKNCSFQNRYQTNSAKRTNKPMASCWKWSVSHHLHRINSHGE